MSRINKPELINRISQKTRISKHDTEQILNQTLIEIEDIVSSGDDVLLKGFGTFMLYNSKPQKGRNIHTGEAIDIPAKKRIKFSPGTEFTNKINND